MAARCNIDGILLDVFMPWPAVRRDEAARLGMLDTVSQNFIAQQIYLQALFQVSEECSN